MIPKVRPHGRIDKSVLAFGEPERVRDPFHLAFIRTLPCSVPGCRQRPVDAHHLKCAPDTPKASGMRSGDQWAVPLCSGIEGHHTGRFGVHLTRAELELDWWQSWGIDPIELARRLWLARRGANTP